MARMRSGIVRVLEWRGPDGAGLPLAGWLVLCIVGWWWARWLAVQEPLAMLFPPFVALAVLVPTLQSALRASRRHPSARLTLAVAEPLLVGLFFTVLAWSTWGYVWKQGLFADSFDHHIMIARAEEYTDRLLRGEYPRFTHFYEGGDSLVDLYPSLANLIALAFRLVLPRSTPFETAYTAMVIFAWWFRGMVVIEAQRCRLLVPRFEEAHDVAVVVAVVVDRDACL